MIKNIVSYLAFKQFWVLTAWMAFLITGGFMSGCSNHRDSNRALEAAGYTNITTHGWAPMSCGQGDTYSTSFTATNPVGRRVKGVVCCGFAFKNCTIRF